MGMAGNEPWSRVRELTSLRDRYNAFIERREVAWELSFAMVALAYVATGFIEDLRRRSLRAYRNQVW